MLWTIPTSRAFCLSLTPIEEGEELANEKNLIPGRLTTEEASKIGRKGGIASGEARRRNKTLKQGLEMILAAPVKDPKDKKALAAMGIPVEYMTQEILIVCALAKKALSGDVAALREVRAWLGEDNRLPNGYDTESSGLIAAIIKAAKNDI